MSHSETPEPTYTNQPNVTGTHGDGSDKTPPVAAPEEPANKKSTPAKPSTMKGAGPIVKEEPVEGAAAADSHPPTTAKPPQPVAKKDKAPLIRVKQEIVEGATSAAPKPATAATPSQPTAPKDKAPLMKVKQEIIEGAAAAAPKPPTAAAPSQPTETKDKAPVVRVKQEVIEGATAAVPKTSKTAVPPHPTATNGKAPVVKVKQERIEGAAAAPQPPAAAAPPQPTASKGKGPVVRVKQEIIEGAASGAPQKPSSASTDQGTVTKGKAPIAPPAAGTASQPAKAKDKTSSIKEEPTEVAAAAVPEPPTGLPAQPKTKGKSLLVAHQTTPDSSAKAADGATASNKVVAVKKAANSAPALQSAAGTIDSSSAAQPGEKAPEGKKVGCKTVAKKATSGMDGAPDQSSSTPGPNAEEIAEADSTAKQDSETKAGKDLKKMLVNQPKKPKNAYMLFSESKRAEVVASHPEAKMGQVMKILGELWAAASDDVKGPFQKQFDKEKIEYEQHMAVYTQSDEYKAYLEAKQTEAKRGKAAKRGKSAGKGGEVNQDAPDVVPPAQGQTKNNIEHPIINAAAPGDQKANTAPPAEKSQALPQPEGSPAARTIAPDVARSAVPPKGSPDASNVRQSNTPAAPKLDTPHEATEIPAEEEQKSNTTPPAKEQAAPDAVDINAAPPAKQQGAADAPSVSQTEAASMVTAEDMISSDAAQRKAASAGRGRGKGKGKGRGRGKREQHTEDAEPTATGKSESASQGQLVAVPALSGDPDKVDAVSQDQLVTAPAASDTGKPPIIGTKRSASAAFCKDCGRGISPLREFGEDEDLVAATSDNAFCGCCTEMLRRQRKLKLNVGDFVWCCTNPASGRSRRNPVPAAVIRIVMTSTDDCRPYLVRLFHGSSYSRIAEQDATSWTEDVKPLRAGTQLAQAVSLAVASGAPPVPGLQGRIASKRASEVGTALKRRAEAADLDTRALKKKRQIIAELLEMQQTLTELKANEEKLQGTLLELRTAGESQISTAEAEIPDII